MDQIKTGKGNETMTNDEWIAMAIKDEKRLSLLIKILQDSELMASLV